MNLKRTLALLVLTILIGFFYFKYSGIQTGRRHDSNQTNQHQRVTHLQKILVLQPGERVSAFSFEILSQEKPILFSLEHQLENWFLTSPVRYPADPLVSDVLLSLAFDGERANSFKLEKGYSLSEYGLNKPKIRICVKTTRNETKRCLILGNDLPLGDACYAKWKHEDEIFSVDANVKHEFTQKTLYGLREKQAFPFIQRDAEEVLIAWEGQSWHLIKQENNWVLRNSEGNKPSNQLAIPLLFQLNRLYVREFDDGSAWKNPQFGLSAGPQRSFQVKNSDGRIKKLVIGSEILKTHGYYGKWGQAPTVLVFSKSKIDEIVKSCRSLVEQNM